MRLLMILLRKEFQQIRRNKAILRIIFLMPAVQLLLLPLAADYEVKQVNLTVVDLDHGTYAQRLTEKLSANDHFELMRKASSYQDALKDVERDAADIILTIPAGFERSLIRDDGVTLHLAVHAVNGAKGNIGSSYAMAIISDFNNEIRGEWMQMPRYSPIPFIEVKTINRFNDKMAYEDFMVPGILVILVTMVGSFLASLNIVHEKETGTIEQINVSPIRKYQFILAKLIPFWFMGLIVLTIGLMISYVVYGIVPVGNIGLIYLFAAVYLLALLGIGLLISTLVETQQQAVLISFFFMMIFILLGGLYTSIDSMPVWAQTVTKFNPVRYFIEVTRMVIMKGSGLRDILPNLYVIGLMAIFFNVLAVFSYRKRA